MMMGIGRKLRCILCVNQSVIFKVFAKTEIFTRLSITIFLNRNAFNKLLPRYENANPFIVKVKCFVRSDVFGFYYK